MKVGQLYKTKCWPHKLVSIVNVTRHKVMFVYLQILGADDTELYRSDIDCKENFGRDFEFYIDPVRDHEIDGKKVRVVYEGRI